MNEAENVEVEAAAVEQEIEDDTDTQLANLQTEIDVLKSDRDAKRTELKELWATATSDFKGSGKERRAFKESIREQVSTMRSEIQSLQQQLETA